MGEAQNGINDAWKLATERFKGEIETTLENLGARVEEVKKSVAETNKCLAEVNGAVQKIQTQLEINRAIQRFKQTIWGAIGGFAATIALALLKELLKTQIFGGK